MRSTLQTCFLAILCALLCVGCLQTPLRHGESAPMRLTGVWQYHWGDFYGTPPNDAPPETGTAGWHDSGEVPNNPPGRDGQTLLWLRTTLPPVLPQGAAIHLPSLDLTAEVFVERQQIYHHGDIDAGGDSSFAGWTDHTIPLPPDAAGKHLLFRVWSNYVNIGLIGTPTLASLSFIERDKMVRSLPILFLATLMVLLSFIGLTLTVKKFREPQYAHFALWSIPLAAYFFTRAPIHSLFFSTPLQRSLVEVLAPPLCAIGATGFINAVLKPIPFGILSKATLGLALYFLAVVLALAAGLIACPVAAVSNNIMLAMLIPLLLACIFWKAWNRDRQAQILLFGFIGVAIGVALDILLAYQLILPTAQAGTAFTPLGMLALIVSFGWIVIRQFAVLQKDLLRHKKVVERISEEGKNISSRLSLGGLAEQMEESLCAIAERPLVVHTFFSSQAVLDNDDPSSRLLHAISDDGRSLAPEGRAIEDIEADYTLVLPVRAPLGFVNLAAVALRGGQVTPEMAKFFEPLIDTLASTLTKLQLKRTTQLLAKQRAQLQLKTRDLTAILANINQGILMINSRLKVQPEHSRHLETLLGRTHCAGADFFELVLENSCLPPDAIAQCRTALESSLDDALHTFELNRHLLPSEIEIHSHGVRRILELEWTPILDDLTVKNLMITLRDVTALRQLRESHRREELEKAILVELIGVTAQDFEDFHTITRQALSDPAPLHVPGARALLKRELHTIKGNARILGFSHLSSAVHEAESRLFSEQDESAAEVLTPVRTTLDLYARLAEHQRNRSHEAQTQLAVRHGLALARAVLDHPDPALAGLGRQVCSDLLDIGYHTLRKILQTCMAGIESLAQKLEAAPPRLTLDVEGSWAFERTCALALQSALAQFFRNSLMHGFAGQAGGEILIEASRVEGRREIVYRDSGSGLDLARLRTLGERAGLLPANASPVQIAELVFLGAISTAGEISEHAGRGVGMAAAREKLARAGVDLCLELLGGNEARCPFLLRMSFKESHFLSIV